jgi:hypothetical protein
VYPVRRDGIDTTLGVVFQFRESDLGSLDG